MQELDNDHKEKKRYQRGLRTWRERAECNKELMETLWTPCLSCIF